MNVLRGARRVLIVLLCLTVLPLAVHAGVYRYMTPWPTSWRHADWSSAGVLAPAAASDEAFLGVYAARTGGWKGVFAVHSWIVTKPAGARRYSRYDVVGWGDPVRRDAYPPDGRWFSNAPRAIALLTGEEAAAAIPRIERAVADYPYARRGDYRIWPGPNSNSFVAHVLAEVPELRIQLPPEALGRDFPTTGRWAGLTPSRTGVFVNLGGYLGLTLAWVEGIEINVLGAVTGLDLRRPAIKLPGFGRIGT